MKNNISTPEQLEELHEFYEEMKDSSYEDVKGVYCVEGAEEGETTAISALTHGNEFAGLAGLKEIRDQAQIIKGKVLLILHNIDAADLFFEHAQAHQYDLEAMGDTTEFRSLQGDHDMNRLPSDLLAHYEDYQDSSTAQRMKELSPVHTQIESILDIHTAHQEAATMSVEDHKNILSDRMKVDRAIKNITKHQSGMPAVGFTRYKMHGSIGFEGGKHPDLKALENVKQASYAFLEAQGQVELPADFKRSPSIPETTTVIDCVKAPNTSFRLTRIYHPGERITVNELIAENPDNGDQIRAKKTGDVLFPLKSREVVNPEKGIFFLTEPKNEK